jgi:2-polyprenyl-3-methyl-5-hydroxy-6-metoxy-1,4-benzoquinol methylase
MRELHPDPDWPESWLESYKYDRVEIFSSLENLGYTYSYENRLHEIMTLVQEAVPPGSTVLDIAAAQGNFTLLLAEKGYRVTWNDLRAELVGYVQLKREYGQVTYAPGNAFDLNVGPFDCVLFCEVIEHVAHPDEFMANVARLLKPGGVAVMTTPNGQYFNNRLPKFSDCADPSKFEANQFKPNADGHIFLLWPDEVRSLAKRAGLVVERQVFFTTPLTNGHLKAHLLLPILPKFVVTTVESIARRLPVSLRQSVMCHTAACFRKS